MGDELKQTEEATKEFSELTEEVAEIVEETASPEQELSVEELKARIAEIEKQLAQARAEAEDFKERWIRVSADFQNLRKRVMQERGEAYNKGKEDAVLALIPVLDNMERALLSLTPENADLNAFKQGLELIVRLFRDALKQIGVEPIPAEGQKFDPFYHEAFERVEREDVEEGLIVKEFERGYKMGEKVIRPAKVGVAVKPKPQLVASSPSEESGVECARETQPPDENAQNASP